MGVEGCQRALTQKRTLWGCGVLEVGDLRLLEDGGERGGALDPEIVLPEPASEGGNGGRASVSTGADTKQTLGSRFERRAAYMSVRNVVLPFRPSASAAPPSGPISLSKRLRAWVRRRLLRSVTGR